MKVFLNKEIVKMYQKHGIDMNNLFMDFISVLRIKYTNDLQFDFVKSSDEICSVEVELSDEVEELLKKYFPNLVNFDKVANIIAAVGYLLGGTVL